MVLATNPYPIEIRDEIIDHVGRMAFDDCLPYHPSMASNGSFIYTNFDGTTADLIAMVNNCSDYRKTLASFLLASTDCRRRALRHMFGHIQISNVRTTDMLIYPFRRNHFKLKHLDLKRAYERIGELQQLIDPPKHSRLGDVGPYIRSLTLDFYSLHRRGGPKRHGKYSHVEDLLDDEIFIYLMKSLHGENFGVTHFSLHVDRGFISSNRWDRNVEWITLSPEFRASFWELVRSRCLKSLNITSIGHLPLWILRGCRAKLLSLVLCPPEIRGVEEITSNPEEHTGLSYPPVENLEVEYSYIFPYRLPDTFDNLKELTVRSHYGRDRSINMTELARIASTTLEKLEVEMFGSFIFDIENIGKLLKLKKFILTIKYDNLSLNPNDSANFQRLLEVEQPLRCLERVVLYFRFSGIGPPYLVDPLWEILDVALSSPMYPALRDIYIYISIATRDHSGNPFPDFEYLHSLEFRLEMDAYLAKCFHRLGATEELDGVKNSAEPASASEGASFEPTKKPDLPDQSVFVFAFDVEP